MTDSRTLEIRLEAPLLRSARAGEHNFINLVIKVAENARFRVESRDISEQPDAGERFTLTHMAPPPDRRGLVFRRVYQYPFWQIEATAERWNWDVAQAAFDPSIHAPDAVRFHRFWGRRQFGKGPQQARGTGYVYVPLQGRLTRRRSFQACSPLDMIGHCLRYDTQRNVVATLHPKEEYTKDELSALQSMERAHPRLTVARGEMETHLRDCDYVVTQNSSAAFFGYFFRKPALLFARIDFHHIAIRAEMDRLEECFAQVATHRPDFVKYVWWFWQEQSINAGRDDAAERIAARFRRFGWPMQ
ncbi:hypothetical protein BOO69_17920 [Sulfitobacter alexandrii]|uniref:Uncharacterized protein n=1 Tax=Sulfitobacter alexandrii TaxID=1917485 RepID=A0A1J0WL81_9RHOB|nr:hypothetical protein [Sulfitobacter alexandrii]APE45079.1 hypothetical protein BOO69_17920 [Sulfitobacter alexandrii]